MIACGRERRRGSAASWQRGPAVLGRRSWELALTVLGRRNAAVGREIDDDARAFDNEGSSAASLGGSHRERALFTAFQTRGKHCRGRSSRYEYRKSNEDAAGSLWDDGQGPMALMTSRSL